MHKCQIYTEYIVWTISPLECKCLGNTQVKLMGVLNLSDWTLVPTNSIFKKNSFQLKAVKYVLTYISSPNPVLKIKLYSCHVIWHVWSVPLVLQYHIHVFFMWTFIKVPSNPKRAVNVRCSDMTGPLPLVLCSCWNVSIFACGSPENVCYVLSTDGMSCIVTIVESLLVLRCSPLLRSTFARLTRGMRYPFPVLGCPKLPETEFAPTLLMARFVFVIVEDTFFRGLLEPPASIRFAWLLLSNKWL